MSTINTLHPFAPVNAQRGPAAVAGAPLEPSSKISATPAVAAAVRSLAQACRSGEASSLLFLPEKGIDYEAFAFSYGTHMPKHLNLEAAPLGNVMRGYLVINPSGHNGDAALKQYATSNSYSVRVTLPDGQVLERNAIARNDPSKAEYATKIAVEFPYMPGTTKIEAWPDGSCRTAGYTEGRLYEMHSPDQPFDTDAQDRKAEAYEAAHPQVRWGTDFEQEDLKTHHVANSPRVYDDM